MTAHAIAARAALVLTAVTAAFVLLAWQGAEDGCTDSVKAMFFALRDRAPDAQVADTVAGVEKDCAGSSRLVDSGAVLFQQGHADLAAGILREAVEREPDNFSAWAGLASVLSGSDPDGAQEAEERARELNPLYPSPS